MDWTQDFGMEIRLVLQKNQKLNAHIDKTGASLCGQDLPKTGLCKRSNCIFQRVFVTSGYFVMIAWHITYLSTFSRPRVHYIFSATMTAVPLR